MAGPYSGLGVQIDQCRFDLLKWGCANSGSTFPPKERKIRFVSPPPVCCSTMYQVGVCCSHRATVETIIEASKTLLLLRHVEAPRIVTAKTLLLKHTLHKVKLTY